LKIQKNVEIKLDAKVDNISIIVHHVMFNIVHKHSLAQSC